MQVARYTCGCMYSSLREIDLEALGDLMQIRGSTDTIHCVLPKLMLVASAFDERLGGEPGATDRPPGSTIPPGMVEGTIGLPMVAIEEDRLGADQPRR